MELILDTYAEPPDPAVPLVCFDESGKELQAHTRNPQPMQPGTPARDDPTYTRHGSANLFIFCAPHLGWRQITVTAQRTKVDWAHAMRDLVDRHFPDAPRIIVVMDNLNTHRPSSLYHTFPPAEARRIARRLDLRFTPVHGSWLNIAELELRVLGSQCLHQRLPDRATLERAVAAWVATRNADRVCIHWRFSTDDARRTMPHVYPLPVGDN